ncbi:hypothetical protein [Neorhodopirellula pilleata]|nr:hypothetical protein [Neorhodopirellula pilleata]
MSLIIFEDAYEAIVSPDVVDAVQGTLAARSETTDVATRIRTCLAD